jgi:NADPH:quinone reductase-like Zn-dependent oxidoreductase
MVVAVGQGVSVVAVGDTVAAMADLNGDGGRVAMGGSGGEGGYAVARQFLTARKPPPLGFRDAAGAPDVLPVRLRGSLPGRPGP